MGVGERGEKGTAKVIAEEQEKREICRSEYGQFIEYILLKNYRLLNINCQQGLLIWKSLEIWSDIQFARLGLRETGDSLLKRVGLHKMGQTQKSWRPKVIVLT